MVNNRDIHSLIDQGYYDSVAELLTLQPDLIMLRDDLGDEPLHVACLAKQVAIVGLLLGRGADPNVRGSNGRTPLHFAVFEGGPISIPIVQALLADGADPTIRDEHGLTAAELAKIDMTTGLGQVLSLLDQQMRT